MYSCQYLLSTVSRRLWKNQAGQDFIEYALITGFVGVAVAFFFPMDIAPNISGIMSKVSSLLNRVP